MKTWEKNRVTLLLTAVSDDLSNYLSAPQDFQVEYLKDLEEAVNQALEIIETAK